MPRFHLDLIQAGRSSGSRKQGVATMKPSTAIDTNSPSYDCVCRNRPEPEGRSSRRAGLARRHHRRRLCDAALRRSPASATAGRRGARPARTRPYIYALSLAIYCTSWTFFGSVGLATERGLEFLAIYIGPVLVFVFGFPLLEAHHRARQGREDHLDRRLPRRALRQELRRRLDRHADRGRRRRALYRAAAQGDLRLGQPDGRALQRRAAHLRSLRQRHLADHRHAACAVRRAVRHAPRRRDRAPGRAGPGGRGRVGRQARRLPRGRHVRHLLPVRQPAEPDRRARRQQRRCRRARLPHVARHLAGDDRALAASPSSCCRGSST